MAKEPVRVLITHAGGEVAHDLARGIGRGWMLGVDQPMILHLLHRKTAADVEAVEHLKWDVNMSMLMVGDYSPLIRDTTATTDAEEACRSVAIAFIIGTVRAVNRTLRLGSSVYCDSKSSVYSDSNVKLLATALGNYAAADCKVLIIAFPADTIALTLKQCAPIIPMRNITCLTRVYPNCANGLLRDIKRLEVSPRSVVNAIVWGSHLSAEHLDINHVMVNTSSGQYPLRELLKDDAWLNGEFITHFHKAVALTNGTGGPINAVGIAKAACDHIHDWVLGTPEGTWVCMGVFSDGSYNIPNGLIFSFPVTCRNRKWTIVQGLPLDELSRKKMDSTVEELMIRPSLNVASVEPSLRMCSTSEKHPLLKWSTCKKRRA